MDGRLREVFEIATSNTSQNWEKKTREESMYIMFLKFCCWYPPEEIWHFVLFVCFQSCRVGFATFVLFEADFRVKSFTWPALC